MKFNKLIPELGVSNFEKSLEFYTKILGFKIEYKRNESKFAFLSFQGSQIMIEQGYKDLNRARILRFGKDDNSGFEDRLITKFDNEFQLFLHCLSIYNLLKTMKRRL